MKLKLLILYTCIALCHFPSSLIAWIISPTIETVTPEKPQAFFTLLADKETSPIAIEIYACHREIDENGVESEVRNKIDFFIYPSHLILQPNQKRMIRVIWKGDKNIKTEMAYRIVAESLPVDFMKGEDVEKSIKFQVKMGTQCLCSFYVQPKGVSEKIICKEAHIEQNEDGKYLNVLIENQGNKHALLTDYTLAIQTQNSIYHYPKNEFIEALNGGINILPKHIRRVRIKIQDSFSVESKLNINVLKNS